MLCESALTRLCAVCCALRQLPTIVTKVGKKNFKPHLQAFIRPMHYSLLCNNNLARVAAEVCGQQLAKLFGPSIFRGAACAAVLARATVRSRQRAGARARAHATAAVPASHLWGVHPAVAIPPFCCSTGRVEQEDPDFVPVFDAALAAPM